MALFYDRTENQNEIIIIFKNDIMTFCTIILFPVLALALVYTSPIDERWQPLLPLAFFGILAIWIIGRLRPILEIAKAMKQGYVEVKGSRHSFKNPLTYRIKK